MRIVVNGMEREVPGSLTVAQLVQELGAGGTNGRGIAVAVEAEVVPRGEWDGVELAEGQRIEVLGAIQGG